MFGKREVKGRDDFNEMCVRDFYNLEPGRVWCKMCCEDSCRRFVPGTRKHDLADSALLVQTSFGWNINKNETRTDGDRGRASSIS